jgi:hypothetical protein
MDQDSTLLEDRDRLVNPATRGDPLAEELQHEGHAVSYQTVAELLHRLD